VPIRRADSARAGGVLILEGGDFHEGGLYDQSRRPRHIAGRPDHDVGGDRSRLIDLCRDRKWRRLSLPIPAPWVTPGSSFNERSRRRRSASRGVRPGGRIRRRSGLARAASVRSSGERVCRRRRCRRDPHGVLRGGRPPRVTEADYGWLIFNATQREWIRTNIHNRHMAAGAVAGVGGGGAPGPEGAPGSGGGVEACDVEPGGGGTSRKAPRGVKRLVLCTAAGRS
jgi:hypothetical protein